MKKTFILMTRSYKYGGYCIAGFDAETNRWIRLVSSADPANSEVPKSVFEPFDDLDILEVETVRAAPYGCQRENFLLDLTVPPKKVGKFPFRALLSPAYMCTSPTVFGNLFSGLSGEEGTEHKRKLLTELGKSYGIGIEQRVTGGGVRYPIVLYGRAAQQFFLDNIDHCVEVIDGSAHR